MLLNRLRSLLGLRSVQPEDVTGDSRERVDNVDAMTATGNLDVNPTQDNPAGVRLPPGYVKSYDEGRPRK